MPTVKTIWSRVPSSRIHGLFYFAVDLVDLRLVPLVSHRRSSLWGQSSGLGSGRKVRSVLAREVPRACRPQGGNWPREKGVHPKSRQVSEVQGRQLTLQASSLTLPISEVIVLQDLEVGDPGRSIWGTWGPYDCL